MKYSCFIPVSFALLVSFAISGKAQQPCEVPAPPVLRTITVDPATQNTVLTWTPSPSDNIAAYIIYTYNDGYGLPVDTIWDPGATSYSRYSTAVKYFSESYVVSAFRLPVCASPLSNSLSTIFCKAEIDTCRKEIIISWNPYKDFPLRVNDYLVKARKDGDAEDVIFSVSRDQTTFKLSDFVTGTRYCFSVSARLEGSLESSSGKACVGTKMQRPPAWIYAEHASAGDGIELSFRIDPDSEIKTFLLERREGYMGPFNPLKTYLNTTLTATYNDRNADISKIWQYRLSAINNCSQPVTLSNTASNIVADLEMTGNDIELSWNGYNNWPEGVSSYAVQVNSGSGYTNAVTVSGTDTTAVIPYEYYMYDITGPSLCFRIEANGEINRFGESPSAISPEKCTGVIENIIVPDAFTPDGNSINDTFRPLLSFSPEQYHFVISDMRRRIIFDSTDQYEEWDGRMNGADLPEGIYLWHLKIKTPSGRELSRTGTVVIIRPM